MDGADTHGQVEADDADQAKEVPAISMGPVVWKGKSQQEEEAERLRQKWRGGACLGFFMMFPMCREVPRGFCAQT